MNLITLLAKINKKADQEHTHSIDDIDGMSDEFTPMENTEIDSIVDNALKN